MHLQFHSNHIIAYNDLGVQHNGIIVIILVQGAAILQKSSVQCAVLFQIIPLAFLLISALFLTQILVFFLIHFGVNLSFYFSVRGRRGSSPLPSGANCGLPLVRPRFAELAICVSPCGAILHMSLSALLSFRTSMCGIGASATIFLCIVFSSKLCTRPCEYDTR